MAVTAQSIDESTAQFMPYPFPTERVLEGEPSAEMAILWKSEDGRSAMGLFRMTPGRVASSLDRDELIVLEAGRRIIHVGDQKFDQLGDTVYLPNGCEFELEVLEESVDRFVIFADKPIPYPGPPAA